MSQTATPPHGQPLYLDRNKSIIWARYLIDSPDWLVFATRVSRAGAPTGTATAAPNVALKLVSCSLISPAGKVVFEAMIKPEEVISANLIAEHGLDYSIVHNAKPFTEVLLKLRHLISGKQILCWDMQAQQSVFDQMCIPTGQSPLPLAGYSLCPEYARFTGEVDNQTGSYKVQPLTTDGISATAECRALLNTLTTMASTSQTRDTAQTGHQNWTAELYKPKVNAKEKIKDFLGL